MLLNISFDRFRHGLVRKMYFGIDNRLYLLSIDLTMKFHLVDRYVIKRIRWDRPIFPDRSESKWYN